MELFKGYVLTKNKKCLEKFKNRTSFKSYEQVKNLPEFAGILNDGIILIDVDDYEESEILFKIVDDLQLRCRVYKTSRGKHFLFKNTNVDTCKIHTKLACGLNADIKLGDRNSYSILKYGDKERTILYDILDDEDYEELPKWLVPIKSNIDFLNLGEGEGRNQSLFNYILTLQANGFTNEEAKECIRIINKYILKESLEEREVETIIRDEAFEKPCFYDGKTFLFDKFARYLISNNHIYRINGQLHIYHEGIYVSGVTKIEAAMIKHIPTLNKTKRTEVLAYIDILQNENVKAADAKYIAFRNGIYNVETDELLPYDPSIIITNKIDHNYNPDAYSEDVDKTLDKLACQDQGIRTLMEETIGYTFYKRNEMRKAFILIGEKSNGKSTFLDMIREVLGADNTSSLDLKDFNHEFKVANLAGSLANIGDDISDEFIVDTAMFKKVVSGDRVNTNKKFEKPFDFNPYCKLLFSANSIPRMGKSRGSEAIIDRLIIIPFNARFSPNDPDYDPYIKYKLRSDEAMEYLIQLGINGLKRILKSRQFTISSKVKNEIEEYEVNNNPILAWFKEIDAAEVIENEPTKNVYRIYYEFCLTNNFTPMSNIEFSKQVKRHFDYEIISKSIKGKTYRVFVLKNE